MTSDCNRLRQILINFVGNSIKFTKNGMIKINISSAQEPNQIIFKVIDTGPGIPETK